MDQYLPDPVGDETFHQCVLDHFEQKHHSKEYAMIRDLLALRRSDEVFTTITTMDGAVVGPHAFILRYQGDQGGERLLAFNFGTDRSLSPAPEPLLAPPRRSTWELLWCSEDPAYGGTGMSPPVDPEGRWHLAGESAAVVKAVPLPEG
jgi:maltooligosyltrehalose trehalohydrolase